jgi:predicted nucleotidyltransferase
MTVPEQLITLIRQETSKPAPPSVNMLAQDILERYGDAVQAILFYGSCFRKGDDAGGIVDLYVLVDNYRHAYRKCSHAFFNKLLPPNVFYLEVPYEARICRSKYAILSIKDFLRGTSMRWFHSYLWGRLAQPAGLVYARNDHIATQVNSALGRAVITLITRILPLMPSQFTSRQLWSKGLELSYAAELRAERRDKLVRLFDSDPDHYKELTRVAMDMVPFSIRPQNSTDRSCYMIKSPRLRRLTCRFAWNVRCVQGKGLSILRLFKGLLTFEGGLNYILWKIERHSGVTVKMDSRLRRVPLLGVGVLFWRLYRRGAFR